MIWSLFMFDRRAWLRLCVNLAFRRRVQAFLLRLPVMLALWLLSACCRLLLLVTFIVSLACRGLCMTFRSVRARVRRMSTGGLEVR